MLQSFCSDNEYQKSLLHPFLYGNYVCATDSHSILMLHATEQDKYQFAVDEKKAPIIDKYMSAQTEFLTYLDQDCLKCEYEKIEKKIKEIDDKCPDCRGKCTVTFDYWSQDNEHYTMEGECPVCHGTGVKDITELKLARDNRMDITPKYSFTINRISDIIRAMGFFKKEKCTLLKESDKNGIPYHIIEPEFHLILMPSLNDE